MDAFPVGQASFTGSDINDVTSDEHVSLIFYLTNATVGYWMEISAINITCKFIHAHLFVDFLLNVFVE